MERPCVFTDSKLAYAGLERKFASEMPLLEQTASWRAGMRYRYSPESYPISSSLYSKLVKTGNLVANLLHRKVIEFRIDYVIDRQDNPFVTEVQTDDRGLPAIAIARNAKGYPQKEFFPGVLEPMTNITKKLTGKKSPTILVTFPQAESFYYAGFFDLARLLRAWGQIDVVPTPKENLVAISKKEISFKQNIHGLALKLKPDLIWDFSQNPIVFRQIQPLVTKQILLDIWDGDGPINMELKSVTPRTVSAQEKEVLSRKKWVLKPLNGRWSKGVVFGYNVTDTEWRGVISSQGANLVAQEFIEPRNERLYIRDGNSFTLENRYARVEGYYIKDPNGGWILADILATCNKELPIHGMRDSIMIPGEMKRSE